MMRKLILSVVTIVSLVGAYELARGRKMMAMFEMQPAEEPAAARNIRDPVPRVSNRSRILMRMASMAFRKSANLSCSYFCRNQGRSRKMRSPILIEAVWV